MTTITASKSKGFTLIELLVVITIISILAAIIFPVFAEAREKARATVCLSNCRQIGTAVQMYVDDNDERIFFYASTAAGQTRSGAVIPNIPSVKNGEKWWNLLMPYLHTSVIYRCPSDLGPTPSNDASGNPTIPRSYIACRSAEGLTLAQISNPIETIVVMDKWNQNSVGAVTDTWIEPFNGDFDSDSANADPNRMYKAANRHHQRANCVMFDGHVKAYLASDIQHSKDLTGCNLINSYPVPGVMTTTVVSAAVGEPNICDPANYPNFAY